MIAWVWAACTGAPPEEVPAPVVPPRVQRRPAGPCDADEMLAALTSGVPVDGVEASDERCAGGYGRLVVTDADGKALVALFVWDAGEWRPLEYGVSSCERVQSVPAEFCEELLQQP
jgi:hypothetical protein